MENTSSLPLCFPYPVKSTFVTLLNGPITCICVVLGCINNAYTLTIMKRLKLGKTLRCYLSVLAFWDISVLVSALCYYGLVALMQWLPISWLQHQALVIWPYLVFLFHGPLTTSITGSVWTVVIIAFARNRAISKPLQSRYYRVSHWPQWVCVITGISAIVYCLPTYFEIRPADCYNEDLDKHSIHLWPEAILTSRNYQLIYRTILYTIFLSLGPFLLVLTLSTHMVIVLKRRNHNDLLLHNLESPYLKRLKSVDENRRLSSHKRTGVMMVVLLVKFLSCNLMSTVVMLCLSVDQMSYQNQWIKDLTDIGNFLIILNSATNSLVYVMWRKKEKVLHSSDLQRKSTKGTLMEMDDREGISLLNTATSVGQILTKSEADILLRSWERVSDRQGHELFARLILYLSESNPNLTQRLHLCNEDNEFSSATLRRLADNQFEFYDSIIRTVAKDPGDFPSARIQQVGQIHFRVGMRFSNEQLRRMKSFLIAEICQTRRSIVNELIHTSGHKGVRSREPKIWNTFLSYVISEIKFGYMTMKTVGV